MLTCFGGTCGSLGTLAALGVDPTAELRPMRLRRRIHVPPVSGLGATQWLGKGCTPGVEPPEDEVALLAQRDGVMKEWGSRLNRCAVGPGQGACLNSVNSHYKPIADDLLAQMMALCDAKRRSVVETEEPPSEEPPPTTEGGYGIYYIAGGAALLLLIGVGYWLGR